MNYEQLKNSILQEAIEGRLVPQDPSEEPAAVLLQRIREEKARLVKEKKIKKDKNESTIYRNADGHWMERFEDKKRPEVCIDEEIPFEIPEGWEWCRIKDIFSMQAGKNISASMIHSNKDNEYLYPCIGGNGIRGYVKVYNHEGDYPIVGRQGALCGNLNMATGKFYATEHAVLFPFLPSPSSIALFLVSRRLCRRWRNMGRLRSGWMR
jgi:type I restriction enzyme S subunit